MKKHTLAISILFLSALALAAAPTTAQGQIDLYITDYMGPQKGKIPPLGGQPTSNVGLRAAPGEYEPFSFVLRPHIRLESVMIRPAGPMTGPAGAIGVENIRVCSVEGFHGGDRDVLVPLGRSWDMSAWGQETFWATIHVPPDAAPGTYRGELVVTSKGQRRATIEMTLEVLPFRLEEPPYALGFNYSSPKDPKKLAVHLRDMREHGMTTVAPLYNFHLPIHDTDTSEIGEFIEAYKRAGFTKPIYFATPMGLLSALAGYGPVDSRRFQRKYIKTMRLLYAETERHGVPVLFSIGDEFTNKALPGIKIGEKLARFCYEELPEIPITSDMNGYLEVVTMAPYLNVATFNNGWDGIDHHNKGRRLINREFVEQVEKLGAIPWFVNAGVGRFEFGFFFWKMARYGVRGKVEWYYNLGNNSRGSVVRTEGLRIYPTLAYERSREGVDDLKYVLKLESLIAEKSKARGGHDPAVQKAEALLKELADSIIDNWTAYRKGGEKWSPQRFRQWRERLIDAILSLTKGA